MKDAHSRKALYVEAINEKRHDTNLLAEMKVENDDLQKENARLKAKYEPEPKIDKLNELHKKLMAEKQLNAKTLPK